MKYQKGDCRIGRNAPCFDGQHTMSVGPRRVQKKAIFGTRDDRAFDPAEPPHRHERRAIGAAYRAKYGKAEYYAMRGRIGNKAGRNIAVAMVARFNEDSRQSEGR